MTFATPEEMTAVMGTAEKNPFVLQVREETKQLKELVLEVRKRG